MMDKIVTISFSSLYLIILLGDFTASNSKAWALAVSTEQPEYSTLLSTNEQTSLSGKTNTDWSSATTKELPTVDYSDLPKTLLNTGSTPFYEQTTSNKPSQKSTTDSPREPIFPRPGDGSTTESPRDPIFPRPGGTTQEPGNVSPRNGSFECIQDLRQYRNDLQERKLYALKMYDSRGKPSSGLLLNFMIRWLGQYDECLKISTRAEDNRGEPAPFNGRYCLVDITVDLELSRQNNTKSMFEEMKPMSEGLRRGHFEGFPNYNTRRGKNVEKMTKFEWRSSQNDTFLSSTESPNSVENGEGLPEINIFSIGVCVPESCNSQNFPDLANRDYLCDNSCGSVNDICEDRLGEGQYLKPKCDYGTDCEDCGARPAIGDSDILGLLPDLPDFLLPGSPESVRNIFGAVIHCTDEKPLSTGALVMLSIIGILVILVVVGSVYDCCRDCKILKSCRKTHIVTSQDEQTLEMNVSSSYRKTEINTDIVIDAHILEDSDREGIDNHALEKEKDMDENYKDQFEVDSKDLTTAIDSETPEHEKQGVWSQMLLAFSVRINTNEIKDPRETTGIPEVNAIYVLSHWWLIFTLCCIGTALYSDNFLKFLDWLNTIFAQAILNWNIAFDSLLFASAISLAYATFEELERNGNINWVLFYLHKVYRMLPTYAAILFFVVYLAEYLIKGPFQYIVEDEARMCYDQWWANLLYFNNLYPFPGNTVDMCMFWTWFLSLIMQYYLISPILIYTLYKKPTFGFGLIFLCFSVCLGSTAWLSAYYGLTASQFQPRYNDRADADPGGAYILNKPYTRISPYLVGIVVAFALFKFKNNERAKISKIVDWFCWAVAITLGCLVVYGLFGTYHGEPLTQFWDVLYMTFAPFAWAIALGWVTFSASAGYSPFIQKFMRWSLWTQLGRLTYVLQISYPITFLVFYIFNREALNHLQVYPILYIFGGNLALSYAYSYLICLLIEYPLIQLEKLIFKDFYLSKLRGIW